MATGQHMSINLKGIVVTLGVISLPFCVGCETREANAETVQVFTNPAPAPPPAAALPSAQAASGATGTTGVTAVAAPVPASAPAAALAGGSSTNAVAATNVVLAAVVPEQMNLSPDLAEVVKLIQAGVSKDVVMAYVTNSTGLFNVGAGEILYLRDLGTPDPVITALIQKDSSPDAQARRQALGAAQPLPTGVALNTPASNVYPAGAPGVANPPEPTPVAPPASAGAPVAAVTTNVVVVQQQPVSVTYFENELAPYGSWVYVSGYGRCWRPTVSVWNAGWRPYSDGGRWLWTDAGWYWYSDYSWGWAPFHYGRWFCPPGVGWVWYPDVYWGPAWVSWRYTGSHCGWAPLPPSAHWVHGRGFYHHSVAVGVGFEFGLTHSDYLFISYDRFCDRRPGLHVVSGHHSHGLYSQSKVVNNYVIQNNVIINKGVGVERVAAATRGDVKKVALRDTSDVRDLSGRRERLEANGQSLSIARPGPGVLAARVQTTTPGGAVPSGSRFSPGTAPSRTVAPSRVSSGSGGEAASGVITRPSSTPRAASPQTVVRPSEGRRASESNPAAGAGTRGDGVRPERPAPRPFSSDNPSSGSSLTRPFVPTRPSPGREPIIISGGQGGPGAGGGADRVSRPSTAPSTAAPTIPNPGSTPNPGPVTRPQPSASPSVGGGMASPPPTRVAPPASRPVESSPSRSVAPAPSRPSYQDSAPVRRIETPRSEGGGRQVAPSRVESAPRSEGSRGNGGGGNGGGRNDNSGGRGRGRD